ncbi:MAG: tRNA lysidine(34) synthetase TilS [Alphaproteobacteria bacterium]|nr:tRNA lysidine(34) synthetase TilS [Alphaproteobacteria bacterium]
MSRGLHHVVAQAVVDRGLWSPGQRVAVAVSGGVDSVALLHLLHRTAGIHRGVLGVITVDHGTRHDSAVDADLVVAQCAALDLPVQRVRLHLGAGAPEAACRDARYAVFADLDVDRVALAHHRDDQAETALLGLLRGGGTRALAGMAWRRGRVVRPLLGVGRDALHQWACSEGLVWRTDPGNLGADHLRSRVRHELLPLIEALRPGSAAALARGAGHAAADDALLTGLAEEAAGTGPLTTAWVASAPEPLVRRALLVRAPDATSAHLDAILGAARRGRGQVFLSPCVSVVVDADEVRMQCADAGADGLPSRPGPDTEAIRERRCRDGTVTSGAHGVPDR